jgi:hypothetical protein
VKLLSDLDDAVRRTRDHGVALDTNLLLLLILGAIGPEKISEHRIVRKWTSQDYELLLRFIARFKRIVVCPNILTETSDLLDDGPPQLVLRALYIVPSLEVHIPSIQAASRPEYSYLGLADSALVELSGQYFILTDDGPLAAAVLDNSGATLHFELLRQMFPPD